MMPHADGFCICCRQLLLLFESVGLSDEVEDLKLVYDTGTGAASEGSSSSLVSCVVGQTHKFVVRGRLPWLVLLSAYVVSASSLSLYSSRLEPAPSSALIA